MRATALAVLLVSCSNADSSRDEADAHLTDAEQDRLLRTCLAAAEERPQTARASECAAMVESLRQFVEDPGNGCDGYDDATVLLDEYFNRDTKAPC